MTISDGVPTEWTASRITRLLRPLKAKCLALSAYMKEASIGSITTYGGRRVPGEQELLPLEVPSNIGLRIHFSRNTVQTLELSKRIHAIRDCFYDLLIKDNSVVGTSPTLPTFSSLTSLCSVILGAQIPCEDGSPETNMCPNRDEALYEAIPPPYRFRTLIMHALHTILNSSSPNASLYLCLLEVTLERRLFHESEVLLEATFEYAFESPPNNVPRISNPVYRRFLVDLYSNWNKQFSPSIFVRLLTGALQRAPTDVVWTSKAIRRLARKLGRYDPSRLPPFLAGIMEVISMRRRISKSTGHLEAQLREWFRFCAEICISSMRSVSDGLVSLKNQGFLNDIIYYYRSWVIQWRTEGSISFVHEFDDGIACLYSLWLSSWPRQIRPDDVLHNHFQLYLPPSSTFTPICDHIFRTKSLNECEDVLLAFAAMVLHHNLPRLHASLWACALYHIEETEIEQIHMDKSGRKAFRDFGLRLVQYVDEAENGCFEETPRFEAFPARDDNDKRATEIHISHPTWSWEASVGCWLRKDWDNQDDVPATPKRRKTTRDSDLQPDKPTSPTMLFRRVSAQVERNSGTSTEDVSSCPPTHGTCDESYTHIDDENQDHNRFFSILNNALSSRASLRQEGRKPLRDDHDNESHQATALPRFEELAESDDTSDTDADDGACQDTDYAPSEDYLDLFRIAGTSPLQVK